MGLRQRVSGMIFGGMMLLSSIFGGLVLLPLPMLFLFVSPRLSRVLSDSMVALWIATTVFLSEVICGIKVVITGHLPDPGEGTLIIMNHRTRLDWLLLFSYAFRYGRSDQFKVVLKYPLKFIPGAGWGMQQGMFLFVERKWESDKAYLSQVLDYFQQINYKPQILIFPEGTDLTPYTKSRSDAFAKKTDIAPFDYVLHPRTTGFSFMAEKMMKDNLITTVLDVTVGYPWNIAQTELQVIGGNIPREVHFHVEKYTKEEMPHSMEDLEEWCRQRWVEKEARLKTFYEEKKFSNSRSPEMTIVKKLRLFFSFLFFSSLVFTMIILLFDYSWVRWYCVIVTLAYYASGKYYDGLDKFISSYVLKKNRR